MSKKSKNKIVSCTFTNGKSDAQRKAVATAKASGKHYRPSRRKAATKAKTPYTYKGGKLSQVNYDNLGRGYRV